MYRRTHVTLLLLADSGGALLDGGVELGGHGRVQALDLLGREARVEVLRAGDGAIEDIVAVVDAGAVLEEVEAVVEVLVEGLDEPAVGLHEHSGAEEDLAVPPVGRARRRARRAEDALVEAVEAVAVDLIDLLLEVPAGEGVVAKVGALGGDVEGGAVIVLRGEQVRVAARRLLHNLLVSVKRARELGDLAGEGGGGHG